MASSYFCPEEPRPLAVISEGYRDEVRGQLPELPPWERYSLGEEYEGELFGLLHRYLEINTTDTLCYVGDTRDHLVYRLEDHFCLTRPVQTVHPGLVHYAETKDHKMLPINIAHVGAEEFFRQLVKEAERGGEGGGGAGPGSAGRGGGCKERKEPVGPAAVKFNKILVHDACRDLSQPRPFYANLVRCLAPGGILLLLHRPGGLCTLPVFKEAQNRLADNDIPYMSIVQDLQSLAPRLDVQWQLESVPVRIRKRKWLAMVRDRYPPHMQLMSSAEVLGGLRELSEGVLKYEGDQVEFDDRLMFVRVTRSKEGDNHMTSGNASQRSLLHGHPVTQSERHHLKLSMTLPPDIKPTMPSTASRSANSSFKFLWD
ncbi:uncharacterized protein LOC143290834 [Babylonia areolata]|uniref:uncharacterized protein LOC143290834 n=1 Tax=Babylonia areolata TaxID=304850 RepID=UPI003FD4C2A5